MQKTPVVGILIFGDPTRGGTIASEVKFLSSLYEQNSDCEFVILTVNPSVTKRVVKEKNTSYNFPHKIVPVFNETKFDVLESLSCLVTYPGHSNFFGGYLNDNVVKMYKIISKCTNELDIPVFIRINDSEIKVRDYRKMCQIRLKGKEGSAFLKDPVNVKKAEDLVSWEEWDYTKVYWFANGSKETCDWVAETMYDREEEQMRMAEKQTFVDNSIYVSDDIFFLIRKNYERFEERYKNNNSNKLQEKFCYIGFFDTVNVARAKAFNVLFKENTQKIPLKIFGKGTEILTKLQGKENIEIEEGFIKGDSEEYFDFLNQHLAYIFIGKGQTESRYIGKTAYDAVVARTPIVVYKKCDSKMITFSNPEFYFENETQLKAILQKLQSPAVRKEWIEMQAEEIFRKLPPSNFRFANYAKNTPARILKEEDFYVTSEISAPAKAPKKELNKESNKEPKKEKLKAISLF
jgi:hypothetical protein